jgi:hypothetical protein
MQKVDEEAEQLPAKCKKIEKSSVLVTDAMDL